MIKFLRVVFFVIVVIMFVVSNERFALDGFCLMISEAQKLSLDDG